MPPATAQAVQTLATVTHHLHNDLADLRVASQVAQQVDKSLGEPEFYQRLHIAINNTADTLERAIQVVRGRVPGANLVSLPHLPGPQLTLGSQMPSNLPPASGPARAALAALAASPVPNSNNPFFLPACNRFGHLATALGQIAAALH